jgi:predicted DNA-binding transcriptional regulator AlpA
MSRPNLTAEIPALALRRAEAAAACGVSLETFDSWIRPNVPAKRLGSVVVYPTAALEQFLATATSMDTDLTGGVQ